ncbi:MAG: alpha/beta fold hydrolase [Planctomycetota bacterium]
MKHALLAMVTGILAVFAPAVAAQPASHEIRFQGDGLELRGTLLLPEMAGGDRVPAVLLLAGSGPTDRDGNQPPILNTNLLRQVAERLAADGIASLRYDKRACRVYASSFPPLDEMGPFFAMDRFVADARGALAWLRERPEIDASRVGVLGHSEGGVVALRVATEEPDSVAAAFLLATPGRPIAVLMREQFAAQLEASGVPDDSAGRALAKLDAAIAAAVAGEPFPENLPPAMRGLFNASTTVLTRDYAEIDPAALAAEVRCPVLILQGERDVQVLAEKDVDALATAVEAAGHGSFRVALLGDASHNFKRVESDRDPGVAGPVLPDALGEIAEAAQDWLVRGSADGEEAGGR